MLSPLTRDYNSLKEKISTLEADGGTDMVNALQSAYEFLNQNGGPGPKDIILVADGQDRYIEVYEPLISANDDIPIYVVGVGDEYDEGLLRAIASQSGGDFFAANNINRLVAVFGEIVRRQGLTQTDASTESSISAGKRIIGWAVFGLMIGLTIGIIDRNKDKVIIGLAGGFAGGALSAILFLGIGQLQVSEGALARGLSFFILGLLLGGALYLVQFSYNKMFKSRDLLDLEKLKQ